MANPADRWTSTAVLHGRDRTAIVGSVTALRPGSWHRLQRPGLGTSGRDLADRGHRVISVDLPGHGLSSAGSAETTATGALASVLRDLLDELGIDKVRAWAFLLGGGIALQFAYQFPERLDTLGLISSGGLRPGPTGVLKWTAMPGSGPVAATAFWPQHHAAQPEGPRATVELDGAPCQRATAQRATLARLRR